METGFIILSIVMLLIGVIVGLFIGKAVTKRRYLRDTQYTQGTLNVDCSISNTQPGLFLGLGTSVEDIMSRKYVSLDVHMIRPNSHE